MSQETPINKLNGGRTMNTEDSRLVDSILNDLNQEQDTQQQMPQEMSQEQHKAMLEHRQQQMMQQQAMMQQQEQQQMEQPLSLVDKIQNEWKSILLVIILSVLVNTSFVDGMFKMNENTYFLLEDGNLNFQSVIIKALSIGIIYFLINNQLK